MSRQTWWQARKQNKLTEELVDLKRQEISMQQTRTKEPDRRCPNCGRVIPFEAKICPYCLKDFEEHLKRDKDKTEEKEERQIDNSNICSKCGFENTTDGKFCGECGNKL